MMLRMKRLAVKGRHSPVIFNSPPITRMNLLSSLAKICANKIGTSPHDDKVPMMIEQL